jgi:sugar phosphate isomerase/epimerase
MIGPSILHSVSYSGSWGQAYLPLDQFIEKAADLGYQGVMLGAKRPHLSPLDYGEAELTRLRSRLEARGLGTVVIAGYTNFTGDLEHGEVPSREIQIQHVDQLVRMARGLGSKIVRVFTSYEHPAASFGAQWNMTVAALAECARRAADSGVIIGVQNHHDIGAGYESMLDLIRAVGRPNCQPLFDAWAPALHGDDASAAARAFGHLAPHTTIADYQLRPRYRYHPALVNYSKELPYTQAVPMGEGFIDYRTFLGGLVDSGFQGSVAYEMCSPLLHGGDVDTLDRYARKFIEYIDSFKNSYRPGSSSA